MPTYHLTYLELVNKVLVRLRERQVTTVDANAYSRLIGEFVNKIKRDVESAYSWESLRDSWSCYTTADVVTYYMQDAGPSVVALDAFNAKSNCRLEPVSSRQMDDFLTLPHPPGRGSPRYYVFNGTNEANHVKVDIYPSPDAAYILQWNLYALQGDFDEDNDTLALPYRPVIEGALAMAYQERGEDGGQASIAQWEIHKQALSDAIAFEAAKTEEDQVWIPK